MKPGPDQSHAGLQHGAPHPQTATHTVKNRNSKTTYMFLKSTNTHTCTNAHIKTHRHVERETKLRVLYLLYTHTTQQDLCGHVPVGGADPFQRRADAV